jgi:hypothetical protein
LIKHKMTAAVTSALTVAAKTAASPFFSHGG